MRFYNRLYLFLCPWPSFRSENFHILQIIFVFNSFRFLLSESAGWVAFNNSRCLCNLWKLSQIFFSYLFGIYIQLKISELSVYLKFVKSLLAQKVVFDSIFTLIYRNLDFHFFSFIYNDWNLFQFLLKFLPPFQFLFLFSYFLFVSCIKWVKILLSAAICWLRRLTSCSFSLLNFCQICLWMSPDCLMIDF